MQRLERHLDRRRRRREQTPTNFWCCSKSTGRAEEGTHRKQKRRKKTPNQLPTWNARKHGGRFYLNCKRLTAVLFASGYPGGCPTPSRRRSYFFCAGGLKSSPSNFSSFPTVAGNETRMTHDFAQEFNFNVRMDEDHFPPLCMLHVQRAQQAEQRQIAAAMKASKKAYDAQKAMLGIETKAVSPATTVGYFSSDDARSGLSSDGNESSSSKTSRSYRFVVAICCCPLGSILCIHAAKYTHSS